MEKFFLRALGRSYTYCCAEATPPLPVPQQQPLPPPPPSGRTSGGGRRSADVAVLRSKASSRHARPSPRKRLWRLTAAFRCHQTSASGISACRKHLSVALALARITKGLARPLLKFPQDHCSLLTTTVRGFPSAQPGEIPAVKRLWFDAESVGTLLPSFSIREARWRPRLRGVEDMKFLSLSEWLPSSKPRSPSSSSSKGGMRRQHVSVPMLTLAFARRSFRVSKRIKKAAAAAGSGVSAAVTSHRFVSKRRALSPAEPSLRRPSKVTRKQSDSSAPPPLHLFIAAALLRNERHVRWLRGVQAVFRGQLSHRPTLSTLPLLLLLLLQSRDASPSAIYRVRVMTCGSAPNVSVCRLGRRQCFEALPITLRGAPEVCAANVFVTVVAGVCFLRISRRGNGCLRATPFMRCGVARLVAGCGA
ncbi:hypothetical protein HPB50_011069 [Hyalomma asiaticum]|uniref:Uncharacterized protein n=1 Tax=Hyalomma asiaticum TaxID=266040 RepID=A0ACB7S4Q7_HYAAI|nr:hypothetical protein HPB50_011069 [Hyalomma asiaticum]